ncbi:MAG TPA: energy transducer TonB [Sphingomicrobium sp.]|nr:energy transducer TonB [Sphingomicrobium sp.]
MRIKAVLALAISAPSLVAASQPLQLQPSSKWVLDYAENSCRLVRLFGEGDNQTTLALESEAPGEMDMLVFGRPLSTFEEQVPARFVPVQAKPVMGRPARATDKGEPAVLFMRVDFASEKFIAAAQKEADDRKAHPGERPPPLNLAAEAMMKADRQDFASKVRGLEVDARPGRPVILETGSLAEPLAMFDKCSRDSLRDWGVDPALEDKIVRPVWAPEPPWKWFSSNDYPRDMAVRREESVVKARLLVDATGRVTKCTSLSHFKEAEFNQIVCKSFMRRGHFEPAELADGTKVPSYYVSRVVFRMAP